MKGLIVMKRFKLALQLYSVRDDMHRDFEGTLSRVKEMGYDGVEFVGEGEKYASLAGYKPELVRDMCARIGLEPISVHVPFDCMVKHPDWTMDYYAAVGCKYIAIPYLTEEYRPGSDKFSEVIENAEALGRAAGFRGMKLLYHNHDFEFVKLGDRYALDVLYSDVPAEYLQTEIDTCWVKVSDVDPSQYILKYSGRAPVVHLKDYFGHKSANMYKLIGMDDASASEPSSFEFRPVGYGVQDFVSILNAAQQAGSEWVVVEQDDPSLGKTPMECAQMSADYLKPIL